MKALLVGLGSIGKRHLDNLRQIVPGARTTILRHRQTSESSSITGAGERVVYDLDDALATDPDFAIISSPAPHHLETARSLARHGVHLCIEKPISDRMEGVDDLIETCRRRRLVLMVAYNLRFYEPLLAMRQEIRRGRIGRVLGFHAEVGQYLPDWRPATDYRRSVTANRDRGGGVLLELSHELDYARWLMGDVSAVSSVATRIGDLEVDVEDLAEVTLCFRNGAVGHIHLNMLQRNASRSCRVIGTDGTLTWDAEAHRVAMYCGRARTWSDIHPASELDRNEMYIDEMRHFLDCVAGRCSPRVTGTDGKRTLEIALAARQSSKLRKAIDL